MYCGVPKKRAAASAIRPKESLPKAPRSSWRRRLCSASAGASAPPARAWPSVDIGRLFSAPRPVPPSEALGAVPLHQPRAGLAEAEGAVELVRVLRVEQPRPVGERAALDHLLDELLAEAAAT